MTGTMADALRDWHDFYVLIGTASATLVGLMFVAASIGASFFTVEREAGLQAFLTPTVLHFCAVLVTCLVVTVPSHSWASLGDLLLAGSAVGLAYSCVVWLRMRSGGFSATIDLVDRIWYVVTPVTSYLLMACAAVALFLRSIIGLDLLALVVVLLLLLGIRNAWDMTVWMVLHSPTR
jgi:predicted neutral ceramidase superfamily lipid hydrolase